MSDIQAQDIAKVFQEIMLDIKRRRATWEALEERCIGKIPQDDPTIRLFGADYLRAQFSDLRKFFEPNDRSYRLRDLTALLVEARYASPRLHKDLYSQWSSEYEATANKYFFHRKTDFTPPDGHSKGGLNGFIDAADTLLDTLVQELKAAGHSVEYLDRNIENDTKEKAVKFFCEIA